MNPPPSQPDDPWDREEQILGRFIRQMMVKTSYGESSDHQSQWSTWTLGLFGAFIVIMLGFVLNAVYTTNGDIHELKGQNQTLQTEVSSLRSELDALSQQVGVLNGARHL